MQTLSAGQIQSAKTIKEWLIIKYADYPQLVTRFRRLPERPFAVPDLGSLNAFHGLENALDFIEHSDSPAPSYWLTK